MANNYGDIPTVTLCGIRYIIKSGTECFVEKNGNVQPKID